MVSSTRAVSSGISFYGLEQQHLNILSKRIVTAETLALNLYFMMTVENDAVYFLKSVLCLIEAAVVKKKKQAFKTIDEFIVEYLNISNRQDNNQ